LINGMFDLMATGTLSINGESFVK